MFIIAQKYEKKRVRGGIFALVFCFNVVKRTLYDIRDNNSYTVRKLADGNCWMTSNLNLSLAADTPVLASSNTSRETYSYIPSSCSQSGNCALNGYTGVSNGAYYYTWFAATAESETTNQTYVDAPASICPKGWRLPANWTISTTRSYGTLTNAYGFTTNGDNVSRNNVTALESFPFNFYRYGLNYSFDTGTSGGYWSSTNAMVYLGVQDAYIFYYFGINGGITNPQHHGARAYSAPIRCIAQ